MSARSPSRRSSSSALPSSSARAGPSTSSTHRPPPRRSSRLTTRGSDSEGDEPRFPPHSSNREPTRESHPASPSARTLSPAGLDEDDPMACTSSQVVRNPPRRGSLRYDPVTDAIASQHLARLHVPLDSEPSGQTQAHDGATRPVSPPASVDDTEQARQGGRGVATRSRKSPTTHAEGDVIMEGQTKDADHATYASPKRRRLSSLVGEERPSSSQASKKRNVQLAAPSNSRSSQSRSRRRASPPQGRTRSRTQTPSENSQSRAGSLENEALPDDATPFIPPPLTAAPPQASRPPPFELNTPFIPPAPPPQHTTSVLNFGQNRYYPAFTETGERVGIPDTPADADAPEIGGSRYYRPRTHRYPPKEANPTFPHVMNVGIVVKPSVAPPKPKRKSKAGPKTSAAKAEQASPRISEACPDPPSPSQDDSGHEGSPDADEEEKEEEDMTPEVVEESVSSDDAQGIELEVRRRFKIPPNVEPNLNVLPDPRPGAKPNHSYPILITLAIAGSPRKMLSLQELYAAIEERFEWYKERHKSTAWKSSIRHQLSLNKWFRLVDRPPTEPGKGRYWTLDFSQGEGNKRPRKRKSLAEKREKREQEAQQADNTSISPSSRNSSQTSLTGSQASSSQQPETAPPPPPPSATPAPAQSTAKAPKAAKAAKSATAPGRPRKPTEPKWVIATPLTTEHSMLGSSSAPQPPPPQQQQPLPPPQPPAFDESVLDPALRDEPPPMSAPLPGHDVSSGRTARSTQRSPRKSPYQLPTELRQSSRLRGRTTSAPEQSLSPVPSFTASQSPPPPSHVFGQPTFGQSSASRFPASYARADWASAHSPPTSPSVPFQAPSSSSANMLGLSSSPSRPDPAAGQEHSDLYRVPSNTYRPKQKMPPLRLTKDAGNDSD